MVGAEPFGSAHSSKTTRSGESGLPLSASTGVLSRAASSVASSGPSPMASTSLDGLLKMSSGPPRLAWMNPSGV